MKGSVVSYTDEVKNLVIYVSKTTLTKKGAVSEEVALEMAEGVREAIGSDIAVSITGLAGQGWPVPEEVPVKNRLALSI